MTRDTIFLIMMLSPAFSVQSSHSLLLRKLFKFHSTGFSSSFPVGRERTIPTITLECNLVKQGESSTGSQVRWHPNWQHQYVVISRGPIRRWTSEISRSSSLRTFLWINLHGQGGPQGVFFYTCLPDCTM